MPLQAAALELRSVNRLLVDDDGVPARYRIPAYQRGYRWTRTQVTQLLDDIWEFCQTSDGGDRGLFYCLQPVVVRKLDDGRYEVVDGQQRLTTLFILLSHRRNILEILSKECFSIEYETRDPSFLANIDLSRSEENVDFYYISEAWQAIEDWLKNRDGTHALQLLQHLLNDDKVGRNVKVIWYELAPQADPIAAFTRLNVGKIPLTEAELVRALFLRRADRDDPTGGLSLRIAYEWDQIEKRLQDDAVWYFLQNRDPADTNRIDLVFNLATRRAGYFVSDEEHCVFSHFAVVLEKEGSADEEWKNVREIFMAIEEWYEDRQLFHTLGFILQQQDGDGLAVIIELLDENRKSGKQDFDQKLRRRVYHMVTGKELATIPTGKPDEEIDSLCRTLTYGDNNKVRSVLLLFNLATLLEDRQSNTRFQFDSFKRESWDIEHIRSVSDSRPSRDSEQKKWLQHCKTYLITIREDEAQALAERIKIYLETSSANRDSFEEIDSEILRYFGENEAGPDHALANLTLLDRGTNRGYRNAVFAVKRKLLLDLDKSGIFVPLCTRNVFLKCYSGTVGNAIFWNGEDAQDYLKAISWVLTRFFAGQKATG